VEKIIKSWPITSGKVTALNSQQAGTELQAEIFEIKSDRELLK